MSQPAQNPPPPPPHGGRRVLRLQNMFFYHHPTSIIIKGYCSPSSPLISTQNQSINQHKNQHKITSQKSTQNHSKNSIQRISYSRKYANFLIYNYRKHLFWTDDADRIWIRNKNLKIQHSFTEYVRLIFFAIYCRVGGCV
jgi:hypothetical protein